MVNEHIDRRLFLLLVQAEDRTGHIRRSFTLAAHGLVEEIMGQHGDGDMSDPFQGRQAAYVSPPPLLLGVGDFRVHSQAPDGLALLLGDGIEEAAQGLEAVLVVAVVQDEPVGVEIDVGPGRELAGAQGELVVLEGGESRFPADVEVRWDGADGHEAFLLDVVIELDGVGCHLHALPPDQSLDF